MHSKKLSAQWQPSCLSLNVLTHWGRVTHICVSKLIIIGSDNDLSPERRQAIIWTNAGILLIRPLGTNFSEILIRNQTFSFKKMHLKMSFGKCRPFCLSLNVLSVLLGWCRKSFNPSEADPIYVWSKLGQTPVYRWPSTTVVLGHQQAQCWVNISHVFLVNQYWLIINWYSIFQYVGHYVWASNALTYM